MSRIVPTRSCNRLLHKCTGFSGASLRDFGALGVLAYWLIVTWKELDLQVIPSRNNPRDFRGALKATFPGHWGRMFGILGALFLYILTYLTFNLTRQVAAVNLWKWGRTAARARRGRKSTHPCGIESAPRMPPNGPF